MFKFSFADPAVAEHADDGTEGSAEEGSADGSPYNIPAEEVPASEGKPTGSQDIVFISPQLSLFKGVISNTQAAGLLQDDRVACNDLIAGVYEGGFKCWEGGVDLAQFLAASKRRRQAQQEQQRQQEQQQPGSQQQQACSEQQEQRVGAPPAITLGPGSRVMELGCGHGLPGLVALWAGAEVHFQDYNRSVIATLTIPNVEANVAAWATRQSATGAAPGAAAATAGGSSAARYFAGSWDSLAWELTQRGLDRSYDVVLTAETIYSLAAMRSLYRCIKACLRPGTGLAYVAAKSYYFGVGGGTAALADMVERDGAYRCRTVAVVDDGLSNKREILELAPIEAAGAGDDGGTASGSKGA